MSYYPYDTIANAPITAFDDGAPVSVKQLEIAIAPVQTGTGDPAPDNVRPIYGFTRADVIVNGVNQWDGETEQGGLNWNTGAPTVSDTYIRSKNACPIKPGMKVFIVKNENTVAIFFYDINGDFISRTGDNTATAPDGAASFKLRIGNGTDPITEVEGVGVNYPSIETDFYDYAGSVTEIEFPAAAGTVYGGTLKYTGGGKYLLTVDRVCRKVTTVTRYSSNISLGSYEDAKTGSLSAGLICSIAKAGITAGSVRYATTSSKIIQIAFPDGVTDEDYNEISALATAEKIDLLYLLATPQTYEITADVVETLYRNNVIFANTGDIITLEYRLNQFDYYRRLVMQNFGYIMMDGGGIDLSSSDPQSITGAWERTVTAIKTGKPIFAYNTKYGSGKNLTPVPVFAWYINSTTAVIVGATLHIQVTSDDTCVVQDVAPSANRAAILAIDALAEQAVDPEEVKTTKAKAKK